MWSRRASVLGLLAVAGCGLSPVYGTGGNGVRRGLIALQAPKNRNAYPLLEQLELRFGTPTNPQYQLSFTLSTSRDRAADDSAQKTRRDLLVGTANWTLRDANGERARGTARRFVSLALGGEVMVSDAVVADANARLADTLAEEIQRQVWTAL